MTISLLAGLLTITMAVETSAPYIAHVVDATAGQTMVISGGGFETSNGRTDTEQCLPK